MTANQFLPALYAAFVLSLPIGHSIAQPIFEKNAAHAATVCEMFKGRSLSVVVPFRAGGGFDIDARAFKPFLQKHSLMDTSVVNVPGAIGMLAARAVADASPNRLVIGLIDPRVVATAPFEGSTGPELSAFAALGSLGSQSAVWITQRPLDWSSARLKVLTASGGGESIARLVLASQAVQLNLAPVTGFNSTNEAWLAALRGEIDIVATSKDTAERLLKLAPHASVAMVLNTEADPDFPGAPYLAGNGGQADRLSRGDSAESRNKRMNLAATAVALSNSSRIFLVSVQTPLPIRRCLEAAIAAAVIDPERLATPIARESNLVPQSLVEATNVMDKLRSDIVVHRKLIEEAASARASQR